MLPGRHVSLCPGQLRSSVALTAPGPVPAVTREHLRQLAETAATIPPEPGTKQYFANNLLGKNEIFAQINVLHKNATYILSSD